MGNALIIYGSTTGNTEYVATLIQKQLEADSHTVTLMNVADTSVAELDKAYDIYMLGCSTWGADEIELQEDFEDFYQELFGDISLNGKAFALFGCGDSSFEYFCGAVDVIENQVDKLGARRVVESLRIDGDPEDVEVKEWVADVLNAI
ncbi:MAG: flavodoxin [Desulfobacterales bacterium]|nr:flavodoxin [Desulfobacterales bacterium]